MKTFQQPAEPARVCATTGMTADVTVLEGVLARGDRKVGDAFWKRLTEHGCTLMMRGHEYFDYDILDCRPLQNAGVDTGFL